MEKRLKCYKCRFFATVDYGYSNYTVIETMIHCLKKHWEEREESYSWMYENGTQEHSFWKQAENCEDFISGERIMLDVDGEIDLEDFDVDLVELAKEYGLTRN